MSKKLKLSSNSVGIGKWRVQTSWKALFLLVVVLMLATTTLMLDQVCEAARGHTIRLVKGLPTSLPKRIVEDKLRLDSPGLLLSGVDSYIADAVPTVKPNNSDVGLVRDIVAFPEEVMLLVELSSYNNSLIAAGKDDLVCIFGQEHVTRVLTVEWKDDSRSVLAVRCEHPPKQVLTESDRKATLLLTKTKVRLPSSVQYTKNSSWTPLVYETVTDSDSVILFVKGLVDPNGKPDNFSSCLDKLYCRFGNGVTSRVIRIAQEVVRCESPPENAVGNVEGARVSLFVPQMGLLPSVAYYSSAPVTPRRSTVSAGKKRQFQICACTMLWNEAQFLREWVIYHGFLGIERWYLYDNNSDDNIEEVIGGLQSEYNVTRHSWPWIKTQEAGFSHCALRARADCEWVLFADVDEFIYPVMDLFDLVYGSSSPSKLKSKVPAAKSWVKWPASVSGLDLALKASSPNRTSVLRTLVERMIQRGKSIGKKVGEVRLVCHNFGPSGLSKAPEDGVMVGYTCRMRWPKRHKSFIFLDAMSDSLMNVVHHFDLKEEYQEIAIHARIAVINHYKFQAWEVFKSKFVRRVATYVVDWREQTAHSNDRAPGLGLEAVEPKDWPSRYCEEVDWGLKNFTQHAFRDPKTKLMLWQ